MHPLDRFVAYITALAIIIGGIMWLSNINFTAEANAKNIAEIKHDQHFLKVKLFDLLRQINTRLSKIEGHLEQSKRKSN